MTTVEERAMTIEDPDASLRITDELALDTEDGSYSCFVSCRGKRFRISLRLEGRPIFAKGFPPLVGTFYAHIEQLHSGKSRSSFNRFGPDTGHVEEVLERALVYLEERVK